MRALAAQHHRFGYRPIRIFPSANNRDINVVVEFVLDGAGNVAELVMLQGTRQERATRTK